VSKYEKEFISMDGKVFSADVYSVLEAFDVTCSARGHAVKKLLMPGQRGAKGELQDLDEALVSVSRAIDMVRARLPEGGTLTGEPMAEPGAEPEPEPKPMTEPEPELEPEPQPKLVTWRRCVRIWPWEVDEGTLYVKWYRSGDIPEDWYPIEAQSQPVETVKQLSEAWEP
jgi:hypothetical protein